MLQRDAHFYICGGVPPMGSVRPRPRLCSPPPPHTGTAMGRDVVGALQRAVAAHGQMSDAAAEGYVKELQAKGRLMQELWS